jgi:ADP-ribose pyrophosphatase YjhB (NUDIX family)
LVVTTLPVTDEDEVVLLRRGIEPMVGLWAQPGGYLEVDETVTEAAIRETLEETGLVVQPGALVGLYTRLEAATVVLVFEASIVGGEPHATPEALEVRSFAAEAIPWADLAFKTTAWALRDWATQRQLLSSHSPRCRHRFPALGSPLSQHRRLYCHSRH